MKSFLRIVWTSEPTTFLRTVVTDGQTSGRKGKGELQTPRRGCTSGRSMMASVCGLWMDTFMKVQVKWSRYRPDVAQRVGRGIALLFHDRGTRRRWMVSGMPRPHFTPGKDLAPILQDAGWAQGRSGQAENLHPTGIGSRTVQPVVSRYTDWATRHTWTLLYWIKCKTDRLCALMFVLVRNKC